MKDENGDVVKATQDLRLRTKAFALRIIRLFSALPKSTVAQGIGKQLLRSGISAASKLETAPDGA
jgi:four helix bundle protein